MTLATDAQSRPTLLHVAGRNTAEFTDTDSRRDHQLQLDLDGPRRRWAGSWNPHVRAAVRRLAEIWDAERRNEPRQWFSWHALWHFAISCWIEAGLPPKTIQTFAGHSSLQVTMDRYGHLFPSDDHGEAMDEIGGEIFAPSAPATRGLPKPKSTPKPS